MNQKPYVIEKVYVETPVDTDGDGKKDLIAVYLRLPKEVEEGKKVPAIYVANPYMLTCNEDWYVPHNVDCEVKAFPAQDIKEEDICFDYEAYEKKITSTVFEERPTMGCVEHAPIDAEPEFECVCEAYEYFNERGYATVLCGGLGTRDSEGFTLTGSREILEAHFPKIRGTHVTVTYGKPIIRVQENGRTAYWFPVLGEYLASHIE